jgi:ribosome recycling factor
LTKIVVDYYGAPTLSKLSLQRQLSMRGNFWSRPTIRRGGRDCQRDCQIGFGCRRAFRWWASPRFGASLTRNAQRDGQNGRKKAEAHKIAVRNIRRDANDTLKKMEKEAICPKTTGASRRRCAKNHRPVCADIEKTRAAKETEISVV